MDADFNVYSSVEAINGKGLLTSIAHVASVILWMMDFDLQLFFPDDTIPNKEELLNDDIYFLAVAMYGEGYSDAELLKVLGQDTILFRKLGQEATRIMATRKGDVVSVGFRGFDLRRSPAIGCIGSPYSTNLEQYGMKGNVTSSFLADCFENEELLQEIYTGDFRRVVVTGHSMGACMAILAGVYIASKRPDVEVCVTAYAPLVFYDDIFLDYALNLSNLTFKNKLFESDMVVAWYNAVKMTDNCKYNDLKLTTRCIPYVDGLGYTHNEVSKYLPISKVFNLASYKTHFIRGYAVSGAFRNTTRNVVESPATTRKRQSPTAMAFLRKLDEKD